MSGLILKLAPHERFLINGAVVENGDRRSRIGILTPDTNLLRLRDALKPEDAKTPVSRLCYIAQLALTGDACKISAKDQLMQAISQLQSVFIDSDSLGHLAGAAKKSADGDFYQALRFLRKLLPLEAELLAVHAP